MKDFLIASAIYLIVVIPVAVFIGRCIRFGLGNNSDKSEVQTNANKE